MGKPFSITESQTGQTVANHEAAYRRSLEIFHDARLGRVLLQAVLEQAVLENEKVAGVIERIGGVKEWEQPTGG